VEWGAQNLALAPGNNGYETLLHEIGHALGLKHPFEGDIRLPGGSDSTANTVMSYTDNGGPYSTFRPYDLAALNWLYGGDGLGGKLGINSLADGRYLTGSASADTLTTASGDDILIGLGGNDVLNGAAGFDTAIYAANRANFTLAKSGNNFTLTDNTGALGNDTLSNIERITFADRTIDFDTNGIAAKAFRVYQAAFDRAPDAGGFGFWIHTLGLTSSIQQVAAGFVSSAEFINVYGANASNASIITKMYNNVLHRAPEQGGFDFWVNVLNQGHPVALVLAEMSESQENKDQVLGTIQNGMEYIPFIA
jgi:serralysin